MKDYNEVAKSVFERSKELIIKRNKRNMRIMTTIRTLGICLVLVSAIGFGSWWSSGQGSDIVLSPNGSLPTLADDNTDLSSVYTETNQTEISLENANEPFMTVCSLDRFTEDDPETHYPTMIFDYESDYAHLNSDPKIPPENGTVHVTQALFDAVKRYGDLDEYGCCENKYIVVIDYYVDGKHINPTEELFERERVRLQKLLGDITGLSFEAIGRNSGETEYYDIHACLTKSQISDIGCIAAEENFGCVIYLRDNYYKINGILPINNPNGQESETPAEISDSKETNKHFCPVHSSCNISSYTKHGNDYDYVPANNTVYISEVLKECMNNNSQQFDDGCCQLYQVKPVYFKDGKVFELDELLLSNESQRLLPFAYENFDPIRCLTCFIDTFDNDNHGIELRLTKEQIESFPASEEYGISLFLAYNYYVEKDGEGNMENPAFADGHF